MVKLRPYQEEARQAIQAEWEAGHRKTLTVAAAVGSVQSLCQEKLLAQFPHDYFQTMIVDEAYHALSSSYQNGLNHFDAARVPGMTATPDRGDVKNLGGCFDRRACDYTIHYCNGRKAVVFLSLTAALQEFCTTRLAWNRDTLPKTYRPGGVYGS
ncbi:MAG: DEAD/DEAH box helicase family protein [Clostridiales bacterium]|nr:DEAD/DEAH box helicase family protein [Clostridiales bacterium]